MGGPVARSDFPSKSLLKNVDDGILGSECARRRFQIMKQFLLLVAVIAVVLGALLFSLYVLDLVKLAELQKDLGKLLGVLGVAAVAGVVIMFLVKTGEKK